MHFSQSHFLKFRPTLRYVPPREEIYDFIIFKAQDIKDLIVCESPKPAPDQYGGLYDPAIVSVSHQIPIQSVNPVPDTYKRKSSTPTPVTDSDCNLLYILIFIKNEFKYLKINIKPKKTNLRSNNF